MTSIEHALDQDPNGIDDYRGQPITSVSVAIRNAGDGLSKALEISPRIFELGETVRVLLEGEVTHHDLELIPKGGGARGLKLVIKADTAMLVDDQASERKLRTMRDRVAKHEEEKKGTLRLAGTDAEDLDREGLEAFNGDGDGDDDGND